jgi:hypothetical protein
LILASAAIAAFFREKAMRFLLQTTFADPNSSSFFMTDYEEGLYFSIADFAFHRNHLENHLIPKHLDFASNHEVLWTAISSYFDI